MATLLRHINCRNYYYYYYPFADELLNIIKLIQLLCHEELFAKYLTNQKTCVRKHVQCVSLFLNDFYKCGHHSFAINQALPKISVSSIIMSFSCSTVVNFCCR